MARTSIKTTSAKATTKPAYETKIADGDVELSFYIFKNRKGDNYTCTVKINGDFVIYTKVRNGKNGWFISWPSYETSNGEYKNQAFCVNKDLLAEFDEAVEDFVRECLND